MVLSVVASIRSRIVFWACEFLLMSSFEDENQVLIVKSWSLSILEGLGYITSSL